MSSIRLSRVLVGTPLVVSSALFAQAQARPSDPQWHPVVSVKQSAEKPCGPIVKPAWYGPRGGAVIVGDHGPCAKFGQEVQRWVGPRGTVPIYR